MIISSLARKISFALVVLALATAFLIPERAKQFLRADLPRRMGIGFINPWLFHSLYHIALFGVIGSTFLFACRTRMEVIFRLLLLVCFSFVTEYVQHLIYRGPLEWLDIRDNSLGLAIPLIIVTLILSRRRR